LAFVTVTSPFWFRAEIYSRRMWWWIGIEVDFVIDWLIWIACGHELAS
jgi:hypothetical protein